MRIAIVGTGLIGASWATHFLAHGLDVVATDPAPGAEERLRAFIDAHRATAALLRGADAGTDGTLLFVADPQEAVQGAEFVQENGPERIDVKRRLFAELDAAAGPGVVLASSSSGLLASDIQEDCRHPERVLVGHPFNPPHVIPLVEVVGGRRTSEAALESAMSFYREVGKRPIRVRKEVMGHVANRLQAAVWREAYGMVMDGVASIEDIDTAVSHGPGLRWSLLGPFAIQMLAGGPGGMQHAVDHLGAALDDWWQDLHLTRLTDEVKARIVADSARQTADWDLPRVIEQRDALLAELILRKQEHPDLP